MVNTLMFILLIMTVLFFNLFTISFYFKAKHIIFKHGNHIESIKLHKVNNFNIYNKYKIYNINRNTICYIFYERSFIT